MNSHTFSVLCELKIQNLSPRTVNVHVPEDHTPGITPRSRSQTRPAPRR